MPLTTTVIGSFPKPDYIKAPDWFKTANGNVEEFNVYLKDLQPTGAFQIPSYIQYLCLLSGKTVTNHNAVLNYCGG